MPSIFKGKNTIPTKFKVGFWATFTSTILDKLLEVLQMKGVVIPPTLLDLSFYALIVLLVFGLVMLILGIIEWVGKSRGQKEIIAKQNADITKLEYNIELLRQRLNAHNQRIRNLRQSLDELFYDARTKRPTETEYQTTEYQARIKACRILATSTENSMVIERTTAILNLIHLYVRRVQEALKEANADFNIDVVDSTFSERINTELGLLLNEVQNE
jgi:hypothetical protein